MEAVIVILLLLIALIVPGVILYNRLVRKRNAFKNAFAQIDVQLKRRHDLIPNLVETVQGYAQHERETLTAVIEARNQAEKTRQQASGSPGDPASMAQLGQAEASLGGVLGRLFALSEAYPDLKANQNLLNLQEELTSTENRVAYARQAYNDSAMQYNNTVETVPSNIVAGMFNFTRAGMLEFENRETLQEPPKVQFS